MHPKNLPATHQPGRSASHPTPLVAPRPSPTKPAFGVRVTKADPEIIVVRPHRRKLYVPQNPALYNAAVYGYVGGVNQARDVTNPASGEQAALVGQAALVAQAELFAQQVDGDIPTNPTLGPANVTCLATIVSNVMGLKYPIGLPQSAFTTVAAAIAALYNATASAFVPEPGSTVTGTAPIVVTADNVSINAATDSTAGSMSAPDKAKLDSLSGSSYSQDTGPLTDVSIYDGPIPVPPQLILTGDISPSGFLLTYDATAMVLNQTSGFVNLYVGSGAIAVPPGNYGLNAGLLGGPCVLNLVDLGYDGTYRPTPGYGPQSAQYPFPIDGFYLSDSVYGWYNKNDYIIQTPSRGLVIYDTSGSCATLAPVVGYPTTDWNTQALVTDEAKFAFTVVGPGTPTAWWLPLYNNCTTHLTIKVQARVVSTSGVTETVGDVYSSVQDVVLSKGFVGDVGEVFRLVPQISGSSREWADPSMVGTLVDVQGSGYFGVITVTLAATLDVSTVVDVQVRVYDADVL